SMKDRYLDIDDIIDVIRSRIALSEPAADGEFLQLLHDMIGDLTSAPEPVVIKLYSQNSKLLNETAPRVAEAIDKIKIGANPHPVVDVLNGVENTISGPAVTYQVNPLIAARAGFNPEEFAINAAAVLEGEPAT